MLWPIAFWYGCRPGASVAVEAVIVTAFESVLRVARPIPGKCFIVGWSLPASSPDANASENVAVSEALKDQVRPCWYMKEEVEEGTSATGARSLLMPPQRRSKPVALHWSTAVWVLPSAPIWGGERVGGAQGTRLIEPPSWSVAISSGGWPPFAAAACSVALRARRAAAEVMFEPKRITPPTSPRPMRPSRSELGVVPDMATMSFCPTSCA